MMPKRWFLMQPKGVIDPKPLKGEWTGSLSCYQEARGPALWYSTKEVDKEHTLVSNVQDLAESGVLWKISIKGWGAKVFSPAPSSTVAEFLDVIGTKEFSSLIFIVITAKGSPPPPPTFSKSGLKMVGNVNIVYINLKSENSQETSTKLYVHEFSTFVIK